ncbi:hypothetical protein AB1N83_000799 [Pleurotus pulmonarius]
MVTDEIIVLHSLYFGDWLATSSAQGYKGSIDGYLRYQHFNGGFTAAIIYGPSLPTRRLQFGVFCCCASTYNIFNSIENIAVTTAGTSLDPTQ